MNSVFLELSIILFIAIIICSILYKLKQPLVIGYIITGFLVGPQLFKLTNNFESVEIFSQIGVTFLLFIIGINLNPKIIKEVGKVSIYTGIGQIIFTSIIGFFIIKMLGFTSLESFYLAIAITFSSTIIIIKLLTDKKDIYKLYGKIAVGFLIVQDLAAAIFLILVSAWTNGINLFDSITTVLLKSFILIYLLFIFSKKFLPKITHFFAKSQELLFLFIIAWGIGIAAIFYRVGFSIEIGALFAGIALASTNFNLEIVSKTKSLRDFFIVLFFVLIGINLTFDNINALIVPSIILSIFILIGNPIIVMLIMKYLGYDKKTNFKAGLTVAQISEFSLIIIGLGYKIGHLDKNILTLITLVGIITIFFSTYMIINSDKLYNYLSKYLKFFDGKGKIKDELIQKHYQAVLFGYDKVGIDIIKILIKLKLNFLVIDYNPENIEKLKKKNIDCLYGDAADNDFLDELLLPKIKLLISTITDFDTNLLILKKLRKNNQKAVAILKTDNIEEAMVLYKNKASYIVMPHHLNADKTLELIGKDDFDFDNIENIHNERKKHIAKIKTLLFENK